MVSPFTLSLCVIFGWMCRGARVTDLAMIGGLIAGSLYDPIFLAMLAVAAAVGLIRFWYGLAAAMLISIVFAALRIASIDAKRAELGLAEFPYPGHLAVATTATLMAAFAIVAVARRLRQR
ncbi:hypothetical protein [Aliihoeflea sp. 2WW]|uniref:hypothetical protein n=1 Tax=Aliihoeflea sp. 2WW TaxID=1381123 RepID=UPI000464D297|nr:hypothetical protein [Aliihoeflea sp. 2WW]